MADWTAQQGGLRGDDNQLPRFLRHAFQSQPVAEEGVLEQEPFEIFQWQGSSEFRIEAGLFPAHHGESTASGVRDLEVACPVPRHAHAVFLPSVANQGQVFGG